MIALIVALVSLVLLVFQYCSRRPVLPLTQENYLPSPLITIMPAEINESLTTWYWGEIAIDIPESMDLSRSPIGILIYPNPPQKDISIEFVDKSNGHSETMEHVLVSDHPKDGWSRLPSRGEIITTINEDISLNLGRPAGLSIFHSWKTIGTKQITLMMDVRIKESNKFWEFAYTEILNEPVPVEQFDDYLLGRKKFFLGWLSDFLPTYHWVGKNQKPSFNQLATQFGHIADKDALLASSNIEIYVSYSLGKPKIDYSLNDLIFNGLNLFFTISSTSDIITPKRFLNDSSYSSPESGMVFIEKDRMHILTSANHITTFIVMSKMIRARENNSDFLAYALGLSQTVFKSLRLVESATQN